MVLLHVYNQSTIRLDQSCYGNDDGGATDPGHPRSHTWRGSVTPLLSRGAITRHPTITRRKKNTTGWPTKPVGIDYRVPAFGTEKITGAL